MSARHTAREIAEELRAAITRGDYEPGARLPSRATLSQTYEAAPATVVSALNTLRGEGLIESVSGSGTYVRRTQPLLRLVRNRLSRAERGTFITDAHIGGWTPRSQVQIRIEPARDEIADALRIDPGAEVLVRDRIMFADEQPVQLATSYLPRDLTRDSRIEDEDTGPGGIYARLEDTGHTLARFIEQVRVRPATQHEADQLTIPTGAPVYQIQRTAHTSHRPVETNLITAAADRFELRYEGADRQRVRIRVRSRNAAAGGSVVPGVPGGPGRNVEAGPGPGQRSGVRGRPSQAGGGRHVGVAVSAAGGGGRAPRRGRRGAGIGAGRGTRAQR